jgi:prolipoprotein diacylglyceryltransferase
MEFTLLGRAFMAAIAAWLMIRWEAKRGNAAGCAINIWDAALTATVGGVLVGRLIAMVSSGINPLTDPGQILLVRSGVSTVGAAIAAIAIFAFLARRDVVGLFDAVAPAVLAGLAGWHGGCVVSGECLGVESSLPWAMSLEGSTVTRHPVELYAAALLAAGAIAVALWKQYGRPPAGAAAGAALIIASGTRLATEPLRISLGGGPVLFYVVGVVVGTGIVIWSLAAKRRQISSV